MKSRSRLNRKKRKLQFRIIAIIFSISVAITVLVATLSSISSEDELIRPIPNSAEIHFVETVKAAETTPVPTPTPEPVKYAKVTAYSCGGLKTEAEIRMNCPSLFSGKPKTANGTFPLPYKTVACDKANMGKKFDIEGVGIVKCTDTGGAIKGAGRFDLYVTDVTEARKWGVQQRAYKEVL